MLLMTLVAMIGLVLVSVLVIVLALVRVEMEERVVAATLAGVDGMGRVVAK